MLLFTLTSAYGKAEGTKFNYMIEQAIFTSAFGCSIYQVAKMTDTPITEIKSRLTGEFIKAFTDVVRRLNTILIEALSIADTDQINMEALIDNAYHLTKARLDATLVANRLKLVPILNDANELPLWGYDREESND